MTADVLFVIPSADDTSFNRLVLQSPLPAIAVFVSSTCDISQTYVPIVTRLAERYDGNIRVVTLDIDASSIIASSFGVQLVPTAMLFRNGELLAQVSGYLPEALLDRFFQQEQLITAPHYTLWHPTEQELEDLLIIPLLARWGWRWQRQYGCRVRAGVRSRRGVVDLLVSVDETAAPLTLFENKRRIADQVELQRATAQALQYALALQLPSFVVADATRLWIYQVHDEEALLVEQFAGYELEQDAGRARDLLLALVR